MNEGIKKTPTSKTSLNQENTEVSSPELPAFSDTEERVLMNLHSVAEHHKNPSIHGNREILDKLHQDIGHCESYGLFQRYTSGEIPRLERMFANMEPLINELSADQETQAAAKLLAGRERQVRSALLRYVNLVIKWRRLNEKRVRGEYSVDEFYAVDVERRRIHNALIDSLKVYAQQVEVLIKDGYGDSEHFPFVFWTMASDARKTPMNKTPLFAPAVLENRDFIKDWAIAADFTEQLKILGDESVVLGK